MTHFVLHPRLAADTIFVSEGPLSRLLLMNDARYRWLVLVPRIAGATELLDLAAADRATLVEEIAAASQTLRRRADAARINIGALGNLVPQLHVHVVARRPGDPAWPGPVWGHSPAVPYDDAARAAVLAQLVNAR